jgi:DNA mismatch repair protein MutS
VANAAAFGPTARVMLLTGPNMAGKSTYLRQVALIVLLAQIGSFVPARSAHVGVVDRIFTRIGAHDDIAAGRSTFMVEMIEAATIVRSATSRSLVVLDEVGRGTSTFDGMAIAQAIVEELHDSRRPGGAPKTIFATHYHELTALAETLPKLRTYRVDVLERGEEVVFLHAVVEGGADRSYGVHVARLAGVPERVTRRAAELLEHLETRRP